jgi:hypothetical protein
MNFRELCQDLVKELGIAGGTGPTTVQNQTGELGNVVRWIRDSNLWIDNLWRDWKYLWSSYSGTMQGQSLVIADLREIDRGSVWLDYGLSTASNLTWIEWSEMRAIMARPLSGGRPVHFSVDPSRTLFLDRLGSGYPIMLEYWRKPTKLTNDTDIPDLPEEYHRLIVCRAGIMYGNREAASEVISGMESEYIDLLEKLQSDQLDSFRNERMSGQDIPLQLQGP